MKTDTFSGAVTLTRPKGMSWEEAVIAYAHSKGMTATQTSELLARLWAAIWEDRMWKFNRSGGM
jgi:hypothetical protein